MWLKKGNNFLPNLSREEIIKHYNTEKNVKAKLRLLVILKRKDGKSLTNIALDLIQSKTNIARCLHQVSIHGISAIYDKKQTGKPSKLTGKQKKELKLILLESPQKQKIPFTLWTTKLIQYLINKLYGVLFKIRRIEYLVKELGFSFQKPRQRNRKANTKKQEEFKKKFKKLLNTNLTMDSRCFVLMKLTS
jgi:transposase